MRKRTTCAKILKLLKKQGISSYCKCPVPRKQLKVGMKVELEHTKCRGVAQKIARDHLCEDPKYYTKLRKMEKS